MAYFDPDFVIVASGRNITKDVFSWALNERDNDSSSLSFSVQNQYFQYDGAFNNNNPCWIMFGYRDNMSPRVNMTIKSVQETYDDGHIAIQITAYDELEKLDGGNMRGCFAKGTDAKQAISDTIKAGTGGRAKANVNVTAPKMAEWMRIPVMNQTYLRAIDDLAKMCQDPACSDFGGVDKSLYGEAPQKPDSFKGSVVAGTTQVPSVNNAGIDNRDCSKEGAAEDDTRNIIDANRSRNASQAGHTGTIKATIKLLGYPQFRAHRCVTVLNVGRGSGLWYVESVKHSWTVDGGFYTEASLLRGDNRKAKKGGLCNAPRPMVLHAEIYNRIPTIYCGPRKTESSSQAKFTYGDGQNMTKFVVTEDGTKNKGKGQGSHQKGKLRDKKSTEAAGFESSSSSSL
jgi:hypothetical protein